MVGQFESWFRSDNRPQEFSGDDVCIVEQYIDETLAVHDAADQLTGDKSTRYRTFVMILQLAQEDSDNHSKFIQLLKAIFTLGKPVWDEKGSHFSEYWWDTHDSLWAQFTKMKKFDDKLAQRWIKYHSFTAECIASGITMDASPIFSIIVEALERKLNNNTTTAAADKAHEIHRADIVAAAQYFIHASRYLLDFPAAKWPILSSTTTSELWKGSKGYSAERLAFWKKRWEELSQNEHLSDDMRETARKAEVTMGKAEREKGKKNKKKK